MGFSNKEVTWEGFLKEYKPKVDKWIFRGQSCDEPLGTGLERALNSYGIPLSEAHSIEKYMIRDFRRRYKGADGDMAQDDTLYCLSLMQHYGCPTRLLDWTYSPHIAAFFAVENISFEKDKERKAYVFCLNHEWINRSAKIKLGNGELFRIRFGDDRKSLTDASFIPLYMEAREKFVVAENPWQLHDRLSTQKGVFLVQGDISKSMMENISYMEGWESSENLVRLKILIDTPSGLNDVYEELRLMNITHESLFPGLDGFSRSLKQNLYWYQRLPSIKAAVNPYAR